MRQNIRPYEGLPTGFLQPVNRLPSSLLIGVGEVLKRCSKYLHLLVKLLGQLLVQSGLQQAEKRELTALLLAVPTCRSCQKPLIRLCAFD